MKILLNILKVHKIFKKNVLNLFILHRFEKIHEFLSLF